VSRNWVRAWRLSISWRAMTSAFKALMASAAAWERAAGLVMSLSSLSPVRAGSSLSSKRFSML